MGTQQFSPKKVAKIARLCGIELEMVWNTQGETDWHEARMPGDRHVLVNAKTGEVDMDFQPQGHMTSCHATPTEEPPFASAIRRPGESAEEYGERVKTWRAPTEEPER